MGLSEGRIDDIINAPLIISTGKRDVGKRGAGRWYWIARGTSLVSSAIRDRAVHGCSRGTFRRATRGGAKRRADGLGLQVRRTADEALLRPRHQRVRDAAS